LIGRYIFREALLSWMLVICVLFVILMSNQFAEILRDAAASELPKDAVFAVLGFTSLQYLNFLTPIALFLGIMLALARLNRDAETSALFACGIGPPQLLLPVAMLTVIVGAGSAYLTVVTAPGATRRIEQIKYDAEARFDVGVLEAGRFLAPDKAGTSVLYAERVEGNNIYDVFWSREIDGKVVVILAERGERIDNPATGELSFVLYNGTRHEGVPGALDFTVIEFAEHGIPVREAGRDGFEETVEMRSTASLLRSGDPLEQAELQWRFSAPISLLVLALLAVPLSRSSPREGRFARIGAGLLIYLIYANLLSVARIWLERAATPAWFGMWWVHALIGTFALLLFARDSGWFVRARPVKQAHPA
jgi:lipopolysaccharide export system permease protein